jgi:hypothetical protein
MLFKLNVTYYPTRRRSLITDHTVMIGSLLDFICKKGKPLSIYPSYKPPTQDEIQMAQNKGLYFPPQDLHGGSNTSRSGCTLTSTVPAART